MAVTRRRLLAGLVLAPAGLAGAGWGWHRRTYPYGWSHSCSSQLMFALDAYAADHGGAYPAGGPTPEASLGLLYPKYANEHVLQGKTVPLGAVRAALEGGGLDPDTCGWHYVEGLRKDNDPELALVWDKVGLGHNGERLPAGGHTVLYVGMRDGFVEGADWDGFLRDQERLLKQRAAKGAR